MAGIDITRPENNYALREMGEVKGLESPELINPEGIVNKENVVINYIDPNLENAYPDIDDNLSILETKDGSSISNFKNEVDTRNIHKKDSEKAYVTKYKDLLKRKGLFNNAKSNQEIENTIETEKRLESLRNRVFRNEYGTEVFIKNLFPYVVASSIENIKNLKNTPANLGLLTNTARDVMDNLKTLKYFTPAEFVAYSASNFYSLNFVKASISPKVIAGKKSYVYDGYPDLKFGDIEGSDSLIDKLLLTPMKKNIKDKLLKYSTGRKLLDALSPSTANNNENGNSVLESAKAKEAISYDFDSMEIKNHGKNQSYSFYEKFKVSEDDNYSINYALLKGKLKNEVFKLGYILITPVMNDPTKTTIKIPFQFNPQIDEGSISPKYNATSILNRISDIQSYVGTSSITASLTTNYHVLHKEGTKKNIGIPGSWAETYTLSYIQQIEMALRSLGYPSVNEDSTINDGIRYARPPIIRIVFGNENNSNILNYSLLDGTKRNRYFIANTIDIKKNIMESPMYINDNQEIIDVFGFDVSLGLIEVKQSYFDIPPNFQDYFNTYRDIGFTKIGSGTNVATSGIDISGLRR